MGVRRDEPFDVQPKANGAMARVLRGATAAALALGIGGAVLPGAWGRTSAWAAVVSVITVPLARIAWLGVRWVERRDLRYAAVAFGLLGVVVLSGVAATLM